MQSDRPTAGQVALDFHLVRGTIHIAHPAIIVNHRSTQPAVQITARGQRALMLPRAARP